MLTIERKCSRVRGADAQLGDLNSMPMHKIHCVVLKFAADTRASHLAGEEHDREHVRALDDVLQAAALARQAARRRSRSCSR